MEWKRQMDGAVPASRFALAGKLLEGSPVTEAEWLACNDSRSMVEFVRPMATTRKLQLFAAVCFRRLKALLPDHRQRHAIEMLEDVPENIEVRRSITTGVRHALPADTRRQNPDIATNDPYFVGLMLYREYASSSTAHHAALAPAGLADGTAEQIEQSRILRCIFGPLPFRLATIDPAWLMWHDSLIPQFAHEIYEQRKFEDLPILSDALIDAGCANQEIIDHCRSKEPHCRGCWVVDLLTGRS